MITRYGCYWCCGSCCRYHRASRLGTRAHDDRVQRQIQRCQSGRDAERHDVERFPQSEVRL